MKSRYRDAAAEPGVRHSRGFSLIELLLASVLMAAAGALLMASLIAANRGASLRSDQALMAHALASQLALLDDPLPAVLPEAGPMDEPFETHTATVDLGATESSLQEAALGIEHGAHRAALVTWRRTPADEQP
jgi:Tfp pilus assembly protein PilV